MSTTISEEAVKAAVEAVDEGVNWVAGLFGEKYDNAEEVMRSALTAALPFLTLQGAVKKLEWRKGRAETPFGPYHVIEETNDDEPFWFVMFNGKAAARRGTHDDEESAIFAAQADYEARILSALEPSAARKELMTQIREGTAYGFLNDGSQPEGNPDLDCPYCCGSGHKGDVRPSAARELALEEVKTSGATDVRGLIKTYANAAFEQQGKDIPKYIWHLHFEEFAAAIRALSSPDHIADAGKVEGDGWLPISSAPKDGCFVDLWHVSQGRVPDCRWFTNNQQFTGWHAQQGGRAYNMGGDKMFTHWRPLPSAPASEGAE